jgi:hypothetical protein
MAAPAALPVALITSIARILISNPRATASFIAKRLPAKYQKMATKEITSIVSKAKQSDTFKSMMKADKFFKDLFKGNRTKVNKYNKAVKNASRVDAIKKKAITDAGKGKDAVTEATIKRFQERALKEKIKKLPQVTTKGSRLVGAGKTVKEKKGIGTRKVFGPKDARFTSPGKVKQAKEKIAKEKAAKEKAVKEKTAREKTAREKTAREKTAKDKETKSKELPKFTSKDSVIKGAVDKKSGQRLSIGKRKILSAKGPEGKSLKLKEISTRAAVGRGNPKELKQLQDKIKGMKEPTKKRAAIDKLKAFLLATGIGAGAIAFLLPDEKIEKKKINPKKVDSDKKVDSNKKVDSANKRINKIQDKINRTQSNVERTDYDPNRRKRELEKLAQQREELARLRKRKKEERLKNKSRVSKLKDKYDKYAVYDPSFLGVRSRLKKGR